MIEFIAATYNEEEQFESLLDHVYPFADRIIIADDGSTDNTLSILDKYHEAGMINEIVLLDHTGLPEKVKSEALKLCQPNSWVMMLDCDERYAPGVLNKIFDFVKSSGDITHVWFTLDEYIDNQPTRTFQKCRLFRASAAHFSDSVHVDDWFDGQGAFYGWRVIHNKTSQKQVMREKEYISTYNRLIAEGKMTPERKREVLGFHYFVREEPHG